MLVPHFIENTFRSGLTLVSSNDIIRGINVIMEILKRDEIIWKYSLTKAAVEAIFKYSMLNVPSVFRWGGGRE